MPLLNRQLLFCRTLEIQFGFDSVRDSGVSLVCLGHVHGRLAAIHKFQIMLNQESRVKKGKMCLNGHKG